MPFVAKDIGEEAIKRVEAGAALLDKFIPGWAERINLKTLHLYSGDECILGQISATRAFDSVYRAIGDIHDYGFSLIDYGFFPSFYASEEELIAAWAAVVNERL